MRLTVLELPASYGEPDRVLAAIDARLAAGPPTDLVVVPEAALQGYVSSEGDFDLTPLGEPIDGPTARGTAALARAHGVHLIGSLVLREGGALYNAMTCFDPSGDLIFVYRKRHPWLPETWATAGTAPHPLVDIGRVQVTMAVCYDLQFIPPDAVNELHAAQLLLFPSAWVEQPPQTRVTLLTQLARQFGLHVANANWAPGVVRVPGQGGSCVIAPDGRVTTAPPGGRLDFIL